jgi:AcrR family transcriptional regulator
MDIKRRITEGAAEQFRMYGVKAVTMDSLANHLGMSKRTIYELFSDKDELLIGVLDLMNQKQEELLANVLKESENAIIAIFKLIEINQVHFQQISPAFQADIKKFHYELLVKNSKRGGMPDFRNTQQVIERGITEKLFRPDINVDLVNRCLYLLGRTVFDNNLFPFDEFSRKDVLKNSLNNYLRGISSPEGLNLIDKLESGL